MRILSILLTLATFFSYSWSINYADLYAPDIQGKYCELRPRQCCADRQDECSYPILGTLCYCDEFCNRTRNEDCCPDYWSFCRGISVEPPPTTIRSCYEGDIYYKDGETTKVNCNQCKCQESGGEMRVLCEKEMCLTDPELLQAINRRFEWRATNYSMFWGRRYDEGLTMRLGTIFSRKRVRQMTPIKQIINPSTIPREFDARVKWPGRISIPHDQGWCGASWIFSTVAVASDRFAIMTHGHNQEFLSPQHLLSCNTRNQRGCQGGHLTRAWMFIKKFGLVSDSCYPWQGLLTECRIPKRKKSNTAECPSTDQQGSKIREDLHRVGPVYRISGEQGIMYEIFHSGPVQAIMKVHRDFFSYSSGVYRCSNLASYERSGFHSVRIVGWGEEYTSGRLVKYWVVSNSWGEEWGERGFFRILRGENECLIEEFVIAAWADIDDINTIYDTSYANNNNINNSNDIRDNV